MLGQPKFRTDLALEAADTGDGRLPEGVGVEQTERGGVCRTTVRIETPQAAERLERPVGRYETFEAPLHLEDALIAQIAEALSEMLPDGTVLVAGLGNRGITPDALGPQTADGVIATRHLIPETAEAIGLGELRPVSVVVPGTMGQSGIEAAELVSAAARSIRPAAIVAIDALAARSMERLGATVQLSDSGIAPGAGVMNARAALSRAELGVPVLALGIPTVVDAATLLGDFAPGAESPEAAQQLVVTPRDIDRILSQGARILATALNRALQPSLTPEDVDLLMS